MTAAIRLTSSEHRALIKAAKSHGVSLSAFLRLAGLFYAHNGAVRLEEDASSRTAPTATVGRS